MDVLFDSQFKLSLSTLIFALVMRINSFNIVFLIIFKKRVYIKRSLYTIDPHFTFSPFTTSTHLHPATHFLHTFYTLFTMDSARSAFHEFLSRTPLSHREDELFEVFNKTLDVLSTYMGAREDFEELIVYMQTHFKDFAYQLDESAKRWVPIDYLLFIHDYDSRFEKRLQRFCVQLLEDGFRVVDPDVLIDLGIVGNTGTKFLSWEMTFIFLLQEGHMDEEGSSSKPPTTATTFPAEDSDFFEELPVDMQREEEDASQVL